MNWTSYFHTKVHSPAHIPCARYDSKMIVICGAHDYHEAIAFAQKRICFSTGLGMNICSLVGSLYMSDAKRQLLLIRWAICPNFQHLSLENSHLPNTRGAEARHKCLPDTRFDVVLSLSTSTGCKFAAAVLFLNSQLCRAESRTQTSHPVSFSVE